MASRMCEERNCYSPGTIFPRLSYKYRIRVISFCYRYKIHVVAFVSSQFDMAIIFVRFDYLTIWCHWYERLALWPHLHCSSRFTVLFLVFVAHSLSLSATPSPLLSLPLAHLARSPELSRQNRLHGLGGVLEQFLQIRPFVRVRGDTEVTLNEEACFIG